MSSDSVAISFFFSFFHRAADVIAEDERGGGEPAAPIRRQPAAFAGRLHQLTRRGQGRRHRLAEVRLGPDAQLAAAAALLGDRRRRSHPSHHARGRLCRVKNPFGHILIPKKINRAWNCIH